MKVLGFNGSPRRDGNTSMLISSVFKELEAKGITCELIQVGGTKIHGCRACGACRKKQDKRCAFSDDAVNEYIEKALEADGVIIGSPTYFAGMTPETKALIDRIGYVARANGQMLKGKVGAAITAVRRAGSLNVFNGINQFFLVSGMIVPGSNYWNMAIGREPGEVMGDQEGMNCMKELGAAMAWLLEKIGS